MPIWYSSWNLCWISRKSRGNFSPNSRRNSGDVGKEFGITQKTLRSHVYLPHSPHYEADGGRDQESRTFASWWKTANQFNVIVRRSLICAIIPSLFLSCFILYLYLSNCFPWLVCASLIHLNHLNLNHWSKLCSPRRSNTNGNQINYQMKTEELAIISISFDSDKRWCPEWVISTCPRNFSCLSTTHKFILGTKYWNTFVPWGHQVPYVM